MDQQEFETLIASEEACRAYLASMRWPEGFLCPVCGSQAAWQLATDRWECRACGRQTSLTAGTLFQDTRYPLAVWFQAIWYVTGQKYGASALGLQRVLGLGSYHTAWAWLHRLRRAMVRPGRDRLQGTVQVDETYWGREQTGKRGRGAAGKTLILVAVEHTGRKLGPPAPATDSRCRPHDADGGSARSGATRQHRGNRWLERLRWAARGGVPAYGAPLRGNR